jgi:hypothetical protein
MDMESGNDSRTDGALVLVPCLGVDLELVIDHSSNLSCLQAPFCIQVLRLLPLLSRFADA